MDSVKVGVCLALWSIVAFCCCSRLIGSAVQYCNKLFSHGEKMKMLLVGMFFIAFAFGGIFEGCEYNRGSPEWKVRKQPNELQGTIIKIKGDKKEPQGTIIKIKD